MPVIKPAVRARFQLLYGGVCARMNIAPTQLFVAHTAAAQAAATAAQAATAASTAALVWGGWGSAPASAAALAPRVVAAKVDLAVGGVVARVVVVRRREPARLGGVAQAAVHFEADAADSGAARRRAARDGAHVVEAGPHSRMSK